MSPKEFDLGKYLPPPAPDPRGRCMTNYGRRIIAVYDEGAYCMVCGKSPTLSFDSSDGEYAEIVLCRACLLDMIYGLEPGEPRGWVRL